MGAETVIAVIGLAIAGGSAIQQSKAQKAEGEVQEAELERQAETEKIAAVDREGQRRRRLNQILGTTIAETGARGIKFEGSPAVRAAADIQQAELAEAGAKISDLSRISQLRRAGKGARIRGKTQARGTLLTGAAQAASSASQL